MEKSGKSEKLIFMTHNPLLGTQAKELVTQTQKGPQKKMSIIALYIVPRHWRHPGVNLLRHHVGKMQLRLLWSTMKRFRAMTGLQ